MKRERKFRFWRNGKLLGILKLNEIPLMLGYDEVDDFTGLKDKNGKEIYEGDILDFKIENWEYHYVEWCDKSCAYWLINVKLKQTFWDGFLSSSKASIMEVIGNIYENKDLLETA